MGADTYWEVRKNSQYIFIALFLLEKNSKLSLSCNFEKNDVAHISLSISTLKAK